MPHLRRLRRRCLRLLQDEPVCGRSNLELEAARFTSRRLVHLRRQRMNKVLFPDRVRFTTLPDRGSVAKTVGLKRPEAADRCNLRLFRNSMRDAKTLLTTCCPRRVRRRNSRPGQPGALPPSDSPAAPAPCRPIELPGRSCRSECPPGNSGSVRPAKSSIPSASRTSAFPGRVSEQMTERRSTPAGPLPRHCKRRVWRRKRSRRNSGVPAVVF